MWHQINTRRISLQMCLFWNDGLQEKEFTTYGIGVHNFLNYFDGHKTAYYVGAEDWQKYVEGQKNLLNLRVLVKAIPWEAQQYLEHQLERFRAEFPTNLTALSNEALLQLQKKVGQEVAWTNSRTWMIYLINDLIAEKVKQKLAERSFSAEKIEQYLLNFSTPLDMNEAMKQRVALLELWTERNTLSYASFQERLEAHAMAYEHIPMFGFDHIPYCLADFQKMLEEIVNGDKELADLKSTMHTRQENFNRELEELKLEKTDELYDLIHLLKHTVFVRDYRDTLRQKMYLLDRYMYAEIGRRLGNFSAEEITALTNEEIEDGLLGKKLYDLPKIIVERSRGFLIIQKHSEIVVYSGNEAHERAKFELGLNKLDEVDCLKGLSASRGTASGPARIVETNQDLEKVQSGDVMIALMTRQDFVPAMRKCVAIVTDEGGITNHAAIVSREFKIPCIVGTKIATKIFRDGDVLEVDANNGVIKKQ